MNTRLNNPLLRALDNVLEGPVTSWIINLFIIPFLVLLAIVLPPLALPQRVLLAGYTGIAANTGGSVLLNDGAQFSVPPGALKSGASIRLTAQPAAAFLKSALAKDLPRTLEVVSPLYQPSLQGQPPAQAVLSIPIPDGVDPLTTLDVYGFDGKKWSKLPFQFFLDEQRLEAYFAATVPQGVVLAQTTALPPTAGDQRERILATVRQQEVDRFPVWLKMANPTWRLGQPEAVQALADPERQIILDVLESNNWNRNLTAEKLGINRTTLYKKMKRLGIEAPRGEAKPVPSHASC